MALAAKPAPLALVHFLVVYNGRERRIERREVFHDEERAIAAYTAAEGEYRGRAEVEVVLLGSDSLETLRQTHGVYFESGSEPDLPSLPPS
ncbi:MAG: hypothetical protein IVW53_04605 [Chloroflexi bacterium]|nr:hypothetical protein [Chloroflexota bacterium]